MAQMSSSDPIVSTVVDFRLVMYSTACRRDVFPLISYTSILYLRKYRVKISAQAVLISLSYCGVKKIFKSFSRHNEQVLCHYNFAMTKLDLGLKIH
jgi:hypothetical protein